MGFFVKGNYCTILSDGGVACGNANGDVAVKSPDGRITNHNIYGGPSSSTYTSSSYTPTRKQTSFEMYDGFASLLSILVMYLFWSKYKKVIDRTQKTWLKWIIGATLYIITSKILLLPIIGVFTALQGNPTGLLILAALLGVWALFWPPNKTNETCS